MLGAGGIGGDEGEIDVGALGRAQFLLRLLTGFLETLQGHRVLAEIDPLLLLELIGDVIDEGLVEVVATEVRIAVGADDAEHAVSYLEHRHVERAAAEIEHDDLLLGLLFEAVGERGRRRLVDDSHHLEAGDLTGVLRGLTLGVVEVGRDGDHRLVDLVAEVALGRLLERAEDLRRNLRRGARLVARLYLDVVLGAADDLVGNHLLLAGHFVVAPAHESLDRVDRPPRVGDRLAAGGVADEGFPLVVEGDHARRQPITLFVGDHLGLLPLHHSDDGVGGAQIDADDLLALRVGHGTCFLVAGTVSGV